MPFWSEASGLCPLAFFWFVVECQIQPSAKHRGVCLYLPGEGVPIQIPKLVVAVCLRRCVGVLMLRRDAGDQGLENGSNLEAEVSAFLKRDGDEGGSELVCVRLSSAGD